MSRLVVALAQYPLDPLRHEQAWRAKMERWVEAGAGTGAKLLVFPEYGAMELAHLDGPEASGDLQRAIDAVSARLGLQAEWLAQLSRRYAVTIVAPSGPARRGAVTWNVARVLTPKGGRGEARKSIPTPWEREPWGVEGDAGQGPLLFEVDGVPVGLAICYDIEFPLIARRLAEHGAKLILAPSCTETDHGWQRVRRAAAARALENQCYVAHCPLIGEAPWCPPVEAQTGAAGVWAPMDGPFPASGAVVEGARDEPGWIVAELDFAALDAVRREGGVRGFAHWSEQPGADPLPAPRRL